MFSEQEINKHICEEFKNETWDQEINPLKLVDFFIEQNGSYLYEEIDLQEWQKLNQLSIPISKINNYGDLTCLRVEKTNELDSYKVNYYNSWGDYDYEEMSKKNFISNHSPLNLNVKTRIQVTLKINGKNIKGNTGNFVIHGIKASKMVEELSSLKNIYPKVRKANQIIRVQFTEYKLDGGSYISFKGGNLNLHNAKTSEVVSFIKLKLSSIGFVLNDREWIKKDNSFKKINECPNAIPYNKVHNGLWCLCKIKNGNSWVISTSNNIQDILNKKKDIKNFTYILNPNGSIYRNENDSKTNC